MKYFNNRKFSDAECGGFDLSELTFLSYATFGQLAEAKEKQSERVDATLQNQKKLEEATAKRLGIDLEAERASHCGLTPDAIRFDKEVARLRIISSGEINHARLLSLFIVRNFKKQWAAYVRSKRSKRAKAQAL